MAAVDPAAWQERRDRLSSLLADMANHATTQSLMRCPYKNRYNECTAQFSCRNQRPAPEPAAMRADRRGRMRPVDAGPGSGRKLCRGDDKLDYRTAWETTGAPAPTPPNSQRGSG